ncbi:MAG: CBS domain-containing protein, partial [Coriobacteriales bacterium]|nr:CBS domain-containing protein [Coriobacteriales bacterium]
MLYLSQMLGKPVVDSLGEELGHISDIAIQTGEVFPRITSFAFRGPAKTPFMVSWRKYVAELDDERIVLNVASPDLRFSYLQPDELLLARDLLNKQIVDTQGLKVVRVNDLKLSRSGRQLRLLGAETGLRGLLRSLAPWLERGVVGATRALGHPLQESIIAWNYMELVDRDLSAVKLSISHKRLHELHPADVADILEQLDPQQRAKVFEHLDAQQAAETMSELGDEYQTDIIDDMSDSDASELLASMDPDDAADILGDLPYEKAEKLLWLMGVQDSGRIRMLLGYRDKTAGGIMTPEFITVAEDSTVLQTIEKIRGMSEELETVHYVYTVNASGRVTGALSLRSLVLAAPEERVAGLATHELITMQPDADQEQVAETISKYDLLALPVVDEDGRILGIVTVDDALEVMEEEHDEDLQIAGATSIRDDRSGSLAALLRWLLRRGIWFILWAVVALLTVMAGGFGLFAGALVLVPVVLLFVDNAVALS